MISLEDLGFSPFFSAQVDQLERTQPGLVPARIAADGPASTTCSDAKRRWANDRAASATKFTAPIARPWVIGSSWLMALSAPSFTTSCVAGRL